MLAPTVSRSFTCYTGLIDNVLVIAIFVTDYRLLISSGCYTRCQKSISSPSKGYSGFDLSALNWHKTLIGTREQI